MAHLGGEQMYLPRIERLQEDIHTILLLLKETTGNHTLTEEDITTLDANWNTILMGWQQDELMQNFEFHSHVVDELKKLLRHCRQELIVGNEHRLHFEQLMRFLLETLFDNIESLAKLRGLSANAAVIHNSGHDTQSRIAFLLKEIPEQNRHIISELNALQPFYRHLNTLENLRLQEKSLHRLLLNIQIQILDSPDITTNGDALYYLATDIINSRWNELIQGIEVVDQSVFDGLVLQSL